MSGETNKVCSTGSSRATLSETCFIPSPCTLLDNPAGCEFAWCFERDCPATYNALYSTGYLLATTAPKLVDGIPTMIQEDLKSWLFRIALIQTIPYLATFIVLFIVLMVTNVILIEVGILLILLIIILTMLAVLWMIQYSSNVVYTVETNIRSKINENWKNNPQLPGQLLLTLFEPDTVACYTCGCSGCRCGFTEDDPQIEQHLLEYYRQLGEDIANGTIVHESDLSEESPTNSEIQLTQQDIITI